MINKEIQDLNWNSLTKGLRDKIKADYSEISSLCKKDQYELGQLHTYENIFGIHNLSSKEESFSLIQSG